jgi:hypothetical protein
MIFGCIICGWCKINSEHFSQSAFVFLPWFCLKFSSPYKALKSCQSWIGQWTKESNQLYLQKLHHHFHKITWGLGGKRRNLRQASLSKIWDQGQEIFCRYEISPLHWMLLRSFPMISSSWICYRELSSPIYNSGIKDQWQRRSEARVMPILPAY